MAAWAEACPLGMQAAPEFDPHVRHILSWRFGHENIIRPFTIFRWFKMSSCQLLAKECALSTGKLPRRLAQEQCGWGNWPTNLQQMNEVTRHFCWHQNFVPWGLSAPAPGLYTCTKSWKNCIKLDFKEMFLKLATNDQGDKMFLLTSRFRP